MLKYAKIIDEETKECEVGIGNNVEYYISMGMSEMDVEKSYNGDWYVVGYAPKQLGKSKDEIISEKRLIRNEYLKDSDKYMLQDFPITSTEKNKWKQYRVYLRDFFNDENNALKYNLKTFEEYFPK